MISENAKNIPPHFNDLIYLKLAYSSDPEKTYLQELKPFKGLTYSENTYISLLENAIDELNFTYAVFRTNNYILNRNEQKTFYCHFLNFEQPSCQLQAIHKKATDLIFKSSAANLFLLGYRYDKDSSLYKMGIPFEIIQIILTLKYLEITNFEKFYIGYKSDYKSINANKLNYSYTKHVHFQSFSRVKKKILERFKNY